MNAVRPPQTTPYLAYGARVQSVVGLGRGRAQRGSQVAAHAVVARSHSLPTRAAEWDPARAPRRSLAAPSRHYPPRRESASRALTRPIEWARRAPSRPREFAPGGSESPLCLGPSRRFGNRQV
jgi:hypothetical protein